MCDFEIADGIKEATEEEQIRCEVLVEIEDNHLPEDATQVERMLLRAWLLGNDILHIEYKGDGSVADYVGFDTVADESQPRMGEHVDRYDLRSCESPKDVFDLLNV